MVENHKNKMKSLNINFLIDILNSKKYRIQNEDQLLKFVNEINKENKQPLLYEFVIFENVSSEMMKEFVNINYYSIMTKMTWQNLCSRLTCEVKNDNEKND